jgi:hypothetical protein
MTQLNPRGEWPDCKHDATSWRRRRYSGHFEYLNCRQDGHIVITAWSESLNLNFRHGGYVGYAGDLNIYIDSKVSYLVLFNLRFESTPLKLIFFNGTGKCYSFIGDWF